jgi:hypothetical protein
MAMKLLRPAQVEGGALRTEAGSSDDEAFGLKAPRPRDIQATNRLPVSCSRPDPEEHAGFVTEWDSRLG